MDHRVEYQEVWQEPCRELRMTDWLGCVAGLLVGVAAILAGMVAGLGLIWLVLVM